MGRRAVRRLGVIGSRCIVDALDINDGMFLDSIVEDYNWKLSECSEACKDAFYSDIALGSI